MNSAQWLEKNKIGKNERDCRLLERAVETLQKDILKSTAENPLPWGELRAISPSWAIYEGVWDWDSAFHAIAVSRWDTDLAREQFELFFRNQDDNGMFPDAWRTNGEVTDFLTKPPIFFWAYAIVDKTDPDDEKLKKAYPILVKNENFWRTMRSQDGLFYYSSNVIGKASSKVSEEFSLVYTRAEWAKCESGWDTTPRYDGDIAESLWSIDLCCYMVIAYRSLYYLAKRLGLHDDMAKWKEREEKLTLLINEKLWSDEIGAYCDVYREGYCDGKGATGALSPASFMPLFIGIATPERAAKMAEIAADPEKFYPLMPSISYDHPQYTERNFWRGATWLNINYMAVKGLKNYHFDELADGYKERMLDMCDNEKRGLYEYYDSRTGEGLGAVDYGWSAVFVMEFILNFESEIYNERRNN